METIRYLKLWINQFIFQWNVTRNNFDTIWEYLQEANSEGIGSGKFHVYAKGLEIQVKDLETNDLLPLFYERKEIIEILGEKEEYSEKEYFSRPIINNMCDALEIDFYDPFRNIIKCECFEEDCPDSIAYEQILSDIKLKFAEYGQDSDTIERIFS